jgi:caffeoyl-CoA O-methyltransferase
MKRYTTLLSAILVLGVGAWRVASSGEPDLKGEVDFVFLDALKEDYLKYFKALEPKMKAGAVVVADNVIQSARAMKDFLDFMKASPDWDRVIIRASMGKNDGMAVCYKIR